MPRGGDQSSGKTWKWKKTMEKEAYRKRFLQRVGKRWDEILDAKIDCATGIQALDEEGKIYNIPPNAQMNKDITDQMMGKASESLDVTSKGKSIQLPIYGSKSLSGHNRNSENFQPDKKN